MRPSLVYTFYIICLRKPDTKEVQGSILSLKNHSPTPLYKQLLGMFAVKGLKCIVENVPF